MGFRRLHAMVVTTLVAGTLAIGASTVTAAIDPTLGLDPAVDIVDETIGSLDQVVSAMWVPGGDMLFLTRNGTVRRRNATTGAMTQIASMSVITNWERGALDITAAPDIATSGQYYVYYTPAADALVRVSRFTLGSTAETVVWQHSAGTDGAHYGGTVNFGPDGMLYISIGDGLANPSNSQSLSTVHGKILRINANGTIPTDNPFYDGTGPNADEIWAYGMRNPWRTTFDSATGKYWVADVGGNNDSTAYEEVDIIQRGGNYGWPLCEGPLGQPKAGAVCPSGISGPLHYYAHDLDGGCCFNRSITGGVVYRGASFTPQFQGIYIYGDYASGEINWLKANADATSVQASGILRSGVEGPIWIEAAPDGSIWYINYTSTIHRLRFVGSGNQPPQITSASATPASGSAPLVTTLAATATDPNGDAITYSWNFGDATTGAGASVAHTYSNPGVYSAVVTATAAGQSTLSVPVTVSVGRPPVATITAPVANSAFTAGSSITFQGSGVDPDEGSLAGSQLSWVIEFVHNGHVHPGTAATGASVTLDIPPTGHSFAGTTGRPIRSRWRPSRLVRTPSPWRVFVRTGPRT